MAVRFLQIFVFEEGSGRQYDVSVIGGVSKELFVDHGKQVRTQEPADHLIVIRRDYRWIGVVNKYRFHRRLVQVIQRCGQLRHVHHPGRAAERAFQHQVRPFHRLFIQSE